MCWKCWCCICCCCEDKKAIAREKSKQIDQAIIREDQERQTGDGRVLEGKSYWAEGVLPKTMGFVHCSSVSPQNMKSAGGIAPEFGTEKVVNSNDEPFACGDKFVFVFPMQSLLDTPRPPGAAKRFGFSDGFLYVCELLKGTQYCSQNKALNWGREVAIPQLIPWSRIKGVYKWEKKNGVAIMIKKRKKFEIKGNYSSDEEEEL